MTTADVISRHQTTDRRWWQHQGKGLHTSVWEAYSHARGADRDRATAYRVFREIYVAGTSQREAAGGDDSVQVSRDNALHALINTANSKLLENRPEPQILTSGGDFRLRRQAKKLTNWCSAAVREMRVHQTMAKAWKEASIVGTGAVRVFERDGEPTIELSYCEDIYVDPTEAENDTVMTYYQVRRMDRLVLAGEFPEHARAIAKSAGGGVIDAEETYTESGDHAESTSDLVNVVQAWRVAANSTTPGRHVVCLQDVTLHDQPYESKRGPFTFLRYLERPRGDGCFWGMGLVELNAGAQASVDDMADIADETLESFVPSWFVAEGSIKRMQVDNIVARMYEVNGTQMPQAYSPGNAAEAHQTHKERRIQQMFHLSGVSELDAGAQKPAGLNSGKALQVHQDIKSGRLMEPARALEDAYTEVFERILEVADEIEANAEQPDGEPADEETSEARMRYLAGKGDELEELAYGDVRIKDTLIRVRVFPVSKLSKEPAARWDMLSDMMNAGLIEPEAATEAMEMPDIEAMNSERFASKRWARKLVEMAIDRSVSEEVTPYDDLQMIMQYGTQMRAQARLQGASADELGHLRDLIARAEALIEMTEKQAMAEQAAAAPPPPLPMPVGPGGPMAPGLAPEGAPPPPLNVV